MKKIMLKVVVMSVVLMTGLQARAYEAGSGFEASANLGAVSNYMWRGVSQTRNSAALQAGADISHSSGFYAGTWLSSVDFKLAENADTEQDFYAGYGFTLVDITFDVKRTEYHYASARSLNFGETHVHIAAYDVTIGADYSSDTTVAASDSALHYYGNYSYGLPHEITLVATLGEYDYRDAGWVGGNDEKYTYYAIALNKEILGINVGLAFTDSNIDDNNCEVFAGGDDYCGDVVVISASKTFK